MECLCKNTVQQYTWLFAPYEDSVSVFIHMQSTNKGSILYRRDNKCFWMWKGFLATV